jgi:perosamine synthetase
MTERPRIPVSAPDLSEREEEYVLDCIRSTWISSTGEYIGRFEQRFAELVGSKHAIACNTGTAALHLALLGAGVGPGDEVIVPTLTYIASANAVRYCGADVRFADSLPGTWNVDPRDVERLIGPRTKAIVAVHLFGEPADLEPLRRLADANSVALIEDAAEAHGGTYRGRTLGSIGAIGTFSFYGNKIVTTGEGGMVVTDDDDTARRMLQLRGQGQDFERRYWFPVVGFNYRMTNIAAAIGLAQLETFAEKLARRKEVADRYRSNLATSEIAFQASTEGGVTANWMVAVTLPVADAEERDRVGARLDESGVETRPFFYPLHTLPPYAGVASGSLRVAEDVAARGLCLPTSSVLSNDDVDRVCDLLLQSLERRPQPRTRTIRQLAAGDAPALAKLFEELAADEDAQRNFHPHPLDAATAEEIASYSGRDLYLASFAGNRIVGYAIVRGWDEGFEIPSFGVAVAAAERDSGVGSELLAECIRLARERGAETLMLKVHAENERALSWYRAAGFEVVGETEDGQLRCHLALATSTAKV